MLNSKIYKTENVSRYLSGLSGKKNYLLIVAAFSCMLKNVNAQSPDWLWAKAMGGTMVDYDRAITVDASGNVYTAGLFRVTVDFDPGAGVYNLTSAGSCDIFVSKSDSSGNFLWAKRMGGIDGDAAFSIAIDPAGSGAVYTTGSFMGITDFDPCPKTGVIFDVTHHIGNPFEPLL